MVVDGCFLLEVMRATGLDYAPNDPIFSRHGAVYMVPYIRRDMLMLENQLPLLLLERLIAVETAKPPNSDATNRMVLRSMSPRLMPCGSADVVWRFERFADGANELLKFIEFGGTPRKYMFFDPLIGNLLSGKSMRSRILTCLLAEANQVQRKLTNGHLERSK
nr:unnamed protein product [Digitaria exilis]